MTMFQTARRRLTGWYLLIILVISGLFSMSIYSFLTREVDRFELEQRMRFQRYYIDRYHLRSEIPAPTLLDPSLVRETKQRIMWSLVIINGVIFIIAGGLSYILAGKQLQPIQDIVEEQRQFISDSSHELRTPLTSLKAAFEVYLRGKHHKVTEADVLIEESLDDVNKMQKLADALLSLAQYEGGVGFLPFEETTISKIAECAVKKVAPLAKKKRITVAENITDVTFTASTQALTDAIVILLDNAIKYSPAQTMITLKAFRQGESVVFSVTDQGIGIAKSDLAHVFDRFYRSDEARSTQAEASGFGLGLPIAHQIVQQHRGKIRVESILHSGSVFTITIPIKHTS